MSAVFLAFAWCVGSAIGSFLNVCILRWPKSESVVRPRSRCPKCGAMIAWYDNVPVISWLVLRARCRGCGESISAMYPAIEAVTGGIWVASLIAFGPSLLAIRVAVFCTILLGIAVTDLRDYVIPDGFTVTGLVIVMAGSIAGFLHGSANAAEFEQPVVAMASQTTAAGKGDMLLVNRAGKGNLEQGTLGLSALSEAVSQ